MPLPKPKPNEKEKDFISRCAGDEIMNKEFPETDQRVAVCYSQWRRKNETIDNKINKYLNKK